MTEQERQGGQQFPPIPDVDCMRGIQRKNSMDYLKEFLEKYCGMGDYNYFTATSDLEEGVADLHQRTREGLLTA